MTSVPSDPKTNSKRRPVSPLLKTLRGHIHHAPELRNDPQHRSGCLVRCPDRGDGSVPADNPPFSSCPGYGPIHGADAGGRDSWGSARGLFHGAGGCAGRRWTSCPVRRPWRAGACSWAQQQGSCLVGFRPQRWSASFMNGRGTASTLPISFLFTAIGGIGILYAVGVPWVAFNAGLPIAKALVGVAIFIPGDLAKAGLTAVIAVTIKRSFPQIRAIG